jgi:hypothetical protein
MPRKTLSRRWARLAEQYQGRDGVVFVELIAAAVLEPDTAELLNDRFFTPRRAALRVLWAEGASRGQLDPHADADAMIDLLFGPVTFRLLLGHGPTDAHLRAGGRGGSIILTSSSPSNSGARAAEPVSRHCAAAAVRATPSSSASAHSLRFGEVAYRVASL